MGMKDADDIVVADAKPGRQMPNHKRRSGIGPHVGPDAKAGKIEQKIIGQLAQQIEEIRQIVGVGLSITAEKRSGGHTRA